MRLSHEMFSETHTASAVVRLPPQFSAAFTHTATSDWVLLTGCCILYRYRDIFMTTKETEAVSFAFTTVGSKHSVDVQLKGVQYFRTHR